MLDDMAGSVAPQNRVRALSECGGQVHVDNDVPPRRYFRSGLEMLRMANIYSDEGNFENAYILYTKFITLFVEKLPKHPEYKVSSPEDRKTNKKKLSTVFGIAEEIKKKLLNQYEAEHRKWLEEEAIQVAEREVEEARRAAEAAVLLREQEARLEEERCRRQQHDYISLQEEELRRLAELNSHMTALDLDDLSPPGYEPPYEPPPYSEVAPPGSVTPVPTIPPRELKPSSSSGVPSVDRSLKPVDHFMSVGGVTGNAYSLRSMYVPESLMARFTSLAQSNTDGNKETLGLLCGTMSGGTFRITHLVIPEQTGTADSCDMMGEEKVFDVQDRFNLLTLGWIHTHPSQTAFLSSVDMHQHMGYQKLLPEAIAIVCSPKYGETGFFFLTPHYGLDIIANCSQRGFHPHQQEPRLFEDCPHVKVDAKMAVTVLDLRGNS